MKKIISYPFTIIYYALFGSTLGIFHLLQIITYNFLGYSAHKKTVDLMNFFLLKCLNFLGIKIRFDRLQITPLFDKNERKKAFCSENDSGVNTS